MKLWAFVGTETEIPIDESQANKRELIVKTVTIYWKFKNIIQDVNDSVKNTDVSGQKVVKFSDGYWTFTNIQREFKDKGNTLIGNYHNRTCTPRSTGKDVKLGKLGTMLGFTRTNYSQKMFGTTLAK